jgi:hypothetical protein
MFETLYDMYAGLDKLRCHLDANSVNTLNDPQVPSVGEHDNETAHMTTRQHTHVMIV